ncbi:MAG: hypothetical protein CMM91_06095 [Rickettsiales bacterium]|jgi:uncharacterized protein YaaQ|nr:hypothetical protein [Rickettsiales bacterium]|tara:strand:+ start:19497 stop:19754 length:258 start_codon:yes stop_codon:yes gene_type:complete
MKINSLNFFQRETKCMPHFTTTFLNIRDSDVHGIKNWVYQNCNGRYSITKDVSLKNNKGYIRYKIGFEEPSDLTLFALSGLQVSS